MNCKPNLKALTACVILTVAITGCSSGPSFVPEVTGTVTINGKPYPRVKVTFVPQAPNIDGNFMPSGVTDEEGKFTLVMPGKNPGCPAVSCKVTITEPSPPDSIQENMMSENPDESLVRKYAASLKLRPIPRKYTRLSSTPYAVQVSTEENMFNFDLEK